MISNIQQKLSTEEINIILNNYQAKADQIIRKMINVLVQAHKKADDAAQQQWINKLKK